MRTGLKLLIAFSFFILAFSLAGAVVKQTNNILYGIIENDGSLTETQTSVDGARALGFICGNLDCSDVSGTLWGGNPINAIGSQIFIEYPTVLQNQGYGVFYYKDDYFPYEVKSNYSGNGQAPSGTRYLTKKANCQVPINDLMISHFGNKVIVNVTLSSSISSPVQHAGPLNYVPQQIEHLYAVNSKVDFTFEGPDVLVLSEEISLPASEKRRVSVNTILSAGYYNLTVESNTADGKCINSIPLKVYSNILIEDNRTNVTLPTIAILNPEAKTYNTRAILVNLRATNATSVLYNWNGVNITYNEPVLVTFNEGINTLNAYAVNDVTTARTSVTFNVNTSFNNQSNESDTTPPSPVSNLYLVSKGKYFLNWAWTNPSDSDFDEVIVYLNGVNVANTSSNFFNAVGLQSNKTYTITLNTKDTNGNVNLVNVSNTATTLSSQTTPNGNGGWDKKTSKTVFLPPYEANETIVPFVFEEDVVDLEAPAKKSNSLVYFLMLTLLLASIFLVILLVLLLSSRK